MYPFDFDAWCDLARRDPSAFFRARERAIAEFLDAHPDDRTRLAALQRRIDGLRAAAGTPQRALAAIAGLLDDHLVAMTGQLERLGVHAEAFRRALRQGGRVADKSEGRTD